MTQITANGTATNTPREQEEKITMSDQEIDAIVTEMEQEWIAQKNQIEGQGCNQFSQDDKYNIDLEPSLQYYNLSFFEQP